jgi:hypothetical protein
MVMVVTMKHYVNLTKNRGLTIIVIKTYEISF